MVPVVIFERRDPDRPIWMVARIFVYSYSAAQMSSYIRIFVLRNTGASFCPLELDPLVWVKRLLSATSGPTSTVQVRLIVASRPHKTTGCRTWLRAGGPRWTYQSTTVRGYEMARPKYRLLTSKIVYLLVINLKYTSHVYIILFAATT